jgi:hypothetical protein
MNAIFFRSIMPAAWRAFHSSTSRKIEHWTSNNSKTGYRLTIVTNYRDSEPASIRKYLCTVNLKPARNSSAAPIFHHLKRSQSGIFGAGALSSKRLACGLGVTDPWCVSARSNEEARLRDLQQVHGSRKDSIGLATLHLQEVIVTWPEPYQSSKTFVQHTFKENRAELGSYTSINCAIWYEGQPSR